MTKQKKHDEGEGEDHDEGQEHQYPPSKPGEGEMGDEWNPTEDRPYGYVPLDPPPPDTEGGAKGKKRRK